MPRYHVMHTLVTAADDAARRGCYVSWRLRHDSSLRLHDWCRRMQVAKPLEPGEHHVTVMYSRDAGVDPRLHGDAPLPPPFAAGYGAPLDNRHVGVLGPDAKPGALVLHLDSPILRARFAHWRDRHGLINSFPDYLPHVSLSYAFDEQDPSALVRMAQQPPGMPLVFDTEHVAFCE